MNERKDGAAEMICALREVSKTADRLSAQLAGDAEAVAALRIAVLNASEDAARTAADETRRRLFLSAKDAADGIDPARAAAHRLALASQRDVAERMARALEACPGALGSPGAAMADESVDRFLLRFDAARRAVCDSLADNAKVIEALRLALASMPRR